MPTAYELKFDPSIAARTDLHEKLKKLEPEIRSACGGGAELSITAKLKRDANSRNVVVLELDEAGRAFTFDIGIQELTNGPAVAARCRRARERAA